MAQALTLLAVALQLLLSAQAPNVPQHLRDQAVSVANFAIQVANKVIADNSVSSPTILGSVPVQSVPIQTIVPTVGISQITIGSSKSPSDQHLGVISDYVKLTRFTIQKKNGTVLYTLIPNLVNSYSDGKYGYSNSLVPTLESFVEPNVQLVFTMTITAENGATYTSPLWRASSILFQPELCVADYCQ